MRRLVHSRVRLLACVTSRRLRGEAPWQWDTVDERGETDLDKSYRRSHKRILEVCSQPLPTLAHDDSNPNALIAFGHYDYKLRDNYRFAIANFLGINIRQISLSIAWKAMRFKIEELRGLPFTVGVLFTEEDGVTRLPPEKSEPLAHKLVDYVNRRAVPALLELNIQRAVPPLKPFSESLFDEKENQAMDALEDVIRSSKIVLFVDNSADMGLIKSFQRQCVRMREVPRIFNVELDLDEGSRGSILRALARRCMHIDQLPIVFIHGAHICSGMFQLAQLTRNPHGSLSLMVERPHHVKVPHKPMTGPKQRE